MSDTIYPPHDLAPELDDLSRAYAQLQAENAQLRTALNEARALADAVTAYFNKRGWAHALHSGNDDILEMSDALADYGFAEQKVRNRQ